MHIILHSLSFLILYKKHYIGRCFNRNICCNQQAIYLQQMYNVCANQLLHIHKNVSANFVIHKPASGCECSMSKVVLFVYFTQSIEVSCKKKSSVNKRNLILFNQVLGSSLNRTQNSYKCLHFKGKQNVSISLKRKLVKIIKSNIRTFHAHT